MTRGAGGLLALSILAASCSDGGGAVTGVDAVRGVAERARDAGTVRTALDMTTDSGSVEMRMHGEGEYDFAQEAGRFSAERKVGAIGSPFDTVVDDGHLYSRFPESSTTWFRREWGPDGRGALTQPALAPGGYLDLLTAAGEDDVEMEGTEDVRGVSTTHYVVDLSLDEIVDAVSGDLAEQVEALAPEVEVHPFGVWIDDEGLARRLELTLTLARSADEVVDVTGTVELYDYGTDVEIEPPEEFEER